MKVWIVAKIYKKGYVWVHGLTEENQNVRLLQAEGSFPAKQSRFSVGQIWDLAFHKASQIEPPHSEDVIVTGWKYLGEEAYLRDVLMEKATLWKGDMDQLFNGFLISIMYDNKPFISGRTKFPHISMGFWLPDAPLIKWHLQKGFSSPEQLFYRYYTPDAERFIEYKGFAKPIFKIPEQTLVHVFLSNWWTPGNLFAPSKDSMVERRCYLQISDWYL